MVDGIAKVQVAHRAADDGVSYAAWAVILKNPLDGKMIHQYGLIQY